MENTQRFCPEDRRCTFLHKYKISSGGGGVGGGGGHGNKFHGQPSGLTIFAKIISGGKTKQTRLDDGIVVCLYLPRPSLQDSVSLDVLSKESYILNFIHDISIFLPSIFIVFAFQSFFSHFAFPVCLLQVFRVCCNELFQIGSL